MGGFTLTKLTATRAWSASSIIPRLDPTAPSSELHPQPTEAEQPLDVEALCQAAREHGRQEAAAAFQAEVESLQALSTELSSALEQLGPLRRQILGQSARDIASLVSMLSKKIAGDALILDPEALPSLIESAIAELPSTEELQILVSPGMLDATSERLPEAIRGMLTADPEIDRGCIVRTRFASLDATLETAARAVQDAIDTWLTEQSGASE